MGWALDGRDLYKPSFWYVKNLDPSDLAVAVAGDICEGFVNPWDYLPFYGYWDKLSKTRECLRLGFPIEDVKDYNVSEMNDLIDKWLASYVPDYIKGDARCRDFNLKVRYFFPFAMCNQDTCLYVDHSTMTIYPKDENELKEALMNHFHCYSFDRWMFNRLSGPIQY